MMSLFNHDLRFKNKYRIEGNTAIIEIIKQNGEKFEVIISAHQLPRIIARYPSIFIVGGGYVGGYIRGSNKQERIHRFLANAPKNKFVVFFASEKCRRLQRKIHRLAAYFLH